MATIGPITATEILDEVIQPIEPSFPPEFASVMLRLRLSDSAQERIRDLLSRNNAGNLDAADKTALENYLLVGQFLDLLQAKARVSLKGHAASP
jgi:hypothetical protein